MVRLLCFRSFELSRGVGDILDLVFLSFVLLRLEGWGIDLEFCILPF